MMRESIPRIRRVRFKDGRTIEVLPDARAAHARETAAAAREHVEMLASDPSLSGFVLLWWDRTGDYRCGWRLEPKGAIGMSGLPGYVSSVMTREITQKAIGIELGRDIPQGDPGG